MGDRMWQLYCSNILQGILNSTNAMSSVGPVGSQHISADYGRLGRVHSLKRVVLANCPFLIGALSSLCVASWAI